eukprot:1154429-Pelagomonas_calceolata.AAC.4
MLKCSLGVDARAMVSLQAELDVVQCSNAPFDADVLAMMCLQAELDAIRCQQRSSSIRETGENGGGSTGGAWYAAGANNGRGARRPLSAQRPRSAHPVA